MTLINTAISTIFVNFSNSEGMMYYMKRMDKRQ